MLPQILSREDIIEQSISDLPLDRKMDLYAETEGYTSPPIDIEQFIEDKNYCGEIFGGVHKEGHFAGLPRIHPYWRNHLYDIYPNPFTSPYVECNISGCLTGDTKVDLLDGRSLTMKEIAEEYKDKKFWVLAYDTQTNSWVPAQAHSPRITGYRKVLKITLDNNQSFRCTWNHPLLGKDNKWYAAGHLHPGFSLLSYNRSRLNEESKNYNHKIVDIEVCGYEDVYNFDVDKYHNFPLSCGIVSHNSIGSGKSTIALLGIAYDLHKLLLLEDPHSKWGLIKTTLIAIALFTATRALGSVVLWSQLSDLFELSPFFKKRLCPKPDGSIFPNKVGILSGTRFTHALGTAIISGVIDEANFQTAVTNQAIDSYTHIKRRMQSRFMTLGGELPFRLWMISSKKDDCAFLEEHINSNRDDPKVKIIEAPIYEVFAHRGIYSGVTFKVFVGDNTKDPLIIDGEIPTHIDETRVIEVPIEYRKEFDTDLIGCFTGDTKISLLNGTEVQIKDLVGKDEFWVYSVNKNGLFSPGRGHDARITIEKAPVIELILNDNSTIKCTKNHRFMLLDGSYKEAQYLTPDDSLMPNYRVISTGKFNGYEYVKNSYYYIPTHRAVYESFYEIFKYHVVHHIDRNRLNNDPSNLKSMSVSDHAKIHLTNTWHREDIVTKNHRNRKESWKIANENHELDKDWQKVHRIRSAQQLKDYNISEEHRKAASYVGKTYGWGTKNPTEIQKESLIKKAKFISSYCRTRNSDPKFKVIQQKGKVLKGLNRLINGLFIKDFELDKYNRYKVIYQSIYKTSLPNLSQIAYIYNCLDTKDEINFNQLRNIWKNILEEARVYNHYVLAIKDAGFEDVYDISVDQYHNFALSTGVVVHNSIRDISGRSTISGYKLFKSREQLIKALIIPHAFTAEIIRLSETDKDALKDYLNQNLANTANKSTPRFIHNDGALSGDRFGIAMAFSQGIREVSRVDTATGEIFIMQEHVIVHDFSVGIEAMPGGEIPFWKIREFIIYLRDQLRFNIELVTTDGFMHADFLQLLRKQNFNCELLSVDRTKDPYRSYRRAVMEGRVFSTKHSILEKELLGVEDLGNKVDHPPNGSKDISDAIVGSYYSCQEHAFSSQLYSDRMIQSMQKHLNQSSLFDPKHGYFLGGTI